MTDNELLLYALKNNMLDIGTIRQEAEMKERKKILEQHKNKIWQGANGKWYTELPEKGKRRLVKKAHIEDLENAIIEFYCKSQERQTVKIVFEAWVDQKLKWGEIKEGTYDRYKVAFDRYFKDTDFPDMPVEIITTDYLEDLIKTTIREQQLTSKAYNNMRTLIMGTFRMAKKKGYTKISISEFFGDLELSKRIFAKPEKKAQVFSEDEVQIITEYLRENPTVGNLGILLTFQTGIRMGELSALKAADLKGNRLQIQRQEIKHKNLETGKGTVHEIVDYTKTEAGLRNIILTPAAVETFKQICAISKGEYLMMNGPKKIWTNSFNDYLYKACDAVGIERRSMHKIRKTYGTMLIDSGVDDSLTMAQMGHADITTTRKFYYYSNKNDSSKEAQILKAVKI